MKGILSRGILGSLFNGAISESGVALNVWAFANAEKIRSRSQTLAANVGCTGESDEELCECLKKVPADIILYKTNSVLDIWVSFDLTLGVSKFFGKHIDLLRIFFRMWQLSE